MKRLAFYNEASAQTLPALLAVVALLASGCGSAKYCKLRVHVVDEQTQAGIPKAKVRTCYIKPMLDPSYQRRDSERADEEGFAVLTVATNWSQKTIFGWTHGIFPVISAEAPGYNPGRIGVSREALERGDFFLISMFKANGATNGSQSCSVRARELHAGAVAKITSAVSEDQPPAVMPYRDYLSVVGAKLGCYFTLEYRHQGPAMTMLMAEVTDDLSITSIDSLLRKLRRDLNAFAIFQDQRNPRILHLVDRVLQQQPGYPLDKKLSLDYRGNLVGCEIRDAGGRRLTEGEGLPTVVGKIVGGIDSGSATPDGRDAFDDCITKVQVDAKNQTVRSIFTDCIPLADYGPILWRAVSKSQEGKEKIVVQYYGPMVVK